MVSAGKGNHTADGRMLSRGVIRRTSHFLVGEKVLKNFLLLFRTMLYNGFLTVPILLTSSPYGDSNDKSAIDH